MSTKYLYNGETLSDYQLRKRFSNVSFPTPIKADELPDGVTVVDVQDIVYEPTLSEVKAQKTQEIVSRSNELRNALRSGYSQGEIDTFAQQYEGARDVLDGKGSLFLMNLLSVRLNRVPAEAELKAFAEKITENYDAAKTGITEIIGTQQRLELAVRTATTVEEVGAVAWPA